MPGSLAPAVAHSWRCDGYWSQSSTTLASRGLHGEKLPLLRGWEAADGISKDAASAPHTGGGKKHRSSPPPGAGTSRVSQGIPRQWQLMYR